MSDYYSRHNKKDLLQDSIRARVNSLVVLLLDFSGRKHNDSINKHRIHPHPQNQLILIDTT